jgi:hypothetical protein
MLNFEAQTPRLLNGLPFDHCHEHDFMAAIKSDFASYALQPRRTSCISVASRLYVQHLIREKTG